MRQCLAPSLSTIDCSLWWENLVDEGKGGYQDQNVAIDLEMVAAEIYPREPEPENIHLPTLRGTVGSRIQAPQGRFILLCFSASAGQRQDRRVRHQVYMRMRHFNRL